MILDIFKRRRVRWSAVSVCLYDRIKIGDDEYFVRLEDVDEVKMGLRDRPKKAYKYIGYNQRGDYRTIVTRNRKVLDEIVVVWHKTRYDFRH